MADDNTPEFLADDAEATSDNFVALRNHAKDLARDLKAEKQFREAAEPQLRNAALEAAGIKPDSPQAAAVLKLHEGGELTAEAFKATAETYGITAAPAGEGDGAGNEPLTPEQQQAIASHQRGQQVAGAGTPDDPQSPAARRAAAEASGDPQEVLRVENEIAREWYAKRG